MLAPDAFRAVPVLGGDRIRLEPMTERHFEGLWPMFGYEEGRRLTGTHTRFSEAQVREWMATRAGHHDRADWVIVRVSDDTVLGEVVLLGYEHYDASAEFRIALVGPEVLGQGYGTEAARLVVDHTFDDVGLHRLHLGVYAFNPRAQRVYEKAGFRVEGVHRDALRWDGRWYDEITMGVLATDPRPWRDGKG